MKSLWACIIVAGLAIPAATSIATIRATNRVLVDRNFGDLGIEFRLWPNATATGRYSMHLNSE